MTADPSPDAETVLVDLELSRNRTIQLAAVGTLGLVVAVAAFSALYQVGTGQAPTFRFAPVGVGWWNDAMDILVLLALASAIIVPHEWLHGVAFRYYGGNPRYGVGIAHFILPYAYATSDDRFTRNQFLVVLLAPLVGLTLVGTPVMIALEWSWLVIPLAANAAGAVSDVWMSLTLVGYPPHVSVEDHRDGVRVLGRETDRTHGSSVTAAVWDAIAGAGVASVGLLILLGIGGPLVLGALGIDSMTIGTPGTVTHLFSFTNSPEEFSLGVGPAVPAVGALVGLGYAFVRTRRRHRVRGADRPG